MTLIEVLASGDNKLDVEKYLALPTFALIVFLKRTNWLFLSIKIILSCITCVVYFNQQVGALHAIHYVMNYTKAHGNMLFIG